MEQGVPFKGQGGVISGIILGMSSINDRRRYNVTSPVTGWAHTQSDHCIWHMSMSFMILESGICHQVVISGTSIWFQQDQLKHKVFKWVSRGGLNMMIGCEYGSYSNDR